MSAPDSYDTLRRHARTLETALDSKLTAYSKLASKISRSGLGSSSRAGGFKDDDVEDGDGIGGYKLVEEEVEELCDKVRPILVM
jgi:Golgi SNAP receptor complex protein 1